MYRELRLNSCGRLNLNTGKNLHFNLLDDAAEWDESATLTIVQREDGKVHLVGGFGGVGDEGDWVELQSNTGRFIATGVIGKTTICNRKGLQAIRNEIQSNVVIFSTLD